MREKLLSTKAQSQKLPWWWTLRRIRLGEVTICKGSDRSRRRVNCYQLPVGKHTQQYGSSPLLMEKECPKEVGQ